MQNLNFNEHKKILTGDDGENISSIISKMNENDDKEIAVNFNLHSQSLLQDIKDARKFLLDNKLKLKYIYLHTKKAYLEEDKDMQNVVSAFNYGISKLIGCYITFENENQNLDVVSAQKYTYAQNRIDAFVKKVNNIKIKENGKMVPLSTLEKFIVAYEFVAQNEYDLDDTFVEGTDWVSVINQNKIICSGYASLLKCICDKMFSKDELLCMYQLCETYNAKWDNESRHANNLVLLNDDKYDISGLYVADSCWDCKDKKSSTFAYCLLPLEKMFLAKYNYFVYEEHMGLYSDFYDEKGKETYDKKILYSGESILDIEMKKYFGFMNDAELENLFCKKNGIQNIYEDLAGWQEFLQSYHARMIGIMKNRDDFIHSSKIPLDAYKNALYAIAKNKGIFGDKLSGMYVDKRLKETKEKIDDYFFDLDKIKATMANDKIDTSELE